MQGLYIALDGSFRMDRVYSDGAGRPLYHVRRPTLRRAADVWRVTPDTAPAQPVPVEIEDYRLLGTAAQGRFAVYEQVR